MKTKFLHFIMLLFMLSAGTSIGVYSQSKSINTKNPGQKKTGTIQLFNNKDLSNWVFKLKDPSVDPSTVFKVQNEVIQIAGFPFGYMRTKDSYSDYTLHVEWRWPDGPGNSGVFVHTQVQDTNAIKVIEVQLASGNAGDFMCSKGVYMEECAGNPNRTVKKLAASSEKPAGEWNYMDIICNGNTIEVTVNGEFQNKGTGLSLTGGYICLQSEGRLIEFRNITLTKLKKTAPK
ncbi:MAG TPA: DUF1080 domain-containing protein [Bacteroidales bacterium]|nr:DUF1080 domain-containing protein [Bacteroidales bacterium]